MRALVLCLAFASAFVLLIGCDSDSAVDAAHGRVVMPDGTAAPVGTTVYALASLHGFSTYVVTDSTLTGYDGRFEFTDLQDVPYRLVAGLYDAKTASTWSHVSPMSESVSGHELMASGTLTRLDLHEVTTGATVVGVAVFDEGEAPPRPAEFALMELWRLEGPVFARVDSARADTAGAYGFHDVATGNHIVSGAAWYGTDAPDGPFPAFEETHPFFASPPATTTLDTLWLGDVHVDEPAIYIYPEIPGEFTVRLDLGAGVRITASDPDYGEGWTVHVAADGRIDDAHDFLFYELAMPRPTPPPAGWRLDGARLDEELAALAGRIGLNEAESTEFVAFWSERLPDGEHWAALPVWNEGLDGWSALDVEPAPDSVWRVWVFFAPLDSPIGMAEPELPVVERNGTTVIEWGGAVLPRPPA